MELIFGIHSVNASLNQLTELTELAEFDRVNTQLIVGRKRSSPKIKQCVVVAKTLNIKVKFVDNKKLDLLVAGNHQGIILSTMVITQENPGLLQLLATLDNPVLLLILDGVIDPHNLGACLRTADGAGIDAVIVPKDNAVGLTPAVKKVALGASVPFYQVSNLSRTLAQLVNLGINLVGTDDKATDNIFSVDFTEATAIILGGEGSGLRRLTKEKCQHLVSIPMAGKVSSLNVSVAAGVILYLAVQQRQFKN